MNEIDFETEKPVADDLCGLYRRFGRISGDPKALCKRFVLRKVRFHT